MTYVMGRAACTCNFCWDPTRVPPMARFMAAIQIYYGIPICNNVPENSERTS